MVKDEFFSGYKLTFTTLEGSLNLDLGMDTTQGMDAITGQFA